jgi:hypothetical protein
MNVNYLIDQNIYQKLIKADIDTIRRFNSEIRTILPYRETMLCVTPFTILEAVNTPKFGVPNIDKNEVPKNVSGAINFVFRQALLFYQNNEFLKINTIKDRAAEQSQYVEKNRMAQEIEERCIQRPLKDINFTDKLHFSLATDFLFSYSFDKITTEDVIPTFLDCLFTDDIFSSNINKFRLAKKFWDGVYQKKQIYFN